MARLTRFDVAQHEAAHIVVGAALGLHLRRATARRTHSDLGFAHFADGVAEDLAQAIMLAAGVAWDRALGQEMPHDVDRRYCRELVRSDADVETAIRLAGDVLRTRGPIHANVTRALLEKDLDHADLQALAEGRWPE